MSKMNRTKQTIENNKQCDSCLHSMIADNAVIAVAYLLCPFLSCWCIFSWFLDPVYLSSSHRLTNWLTYSHRFHLILTLAQTHIFYVLFAQIGGMRARSLARSHTHNHTNLHKERKSFCFSPFSCCKINHFHCSDLNCLPAIYSKFMESLRLDEWEVSCEIAVCENTKNHMIRLGIVMT